VKSATWDKLIDSELVPDNRIVFSHRRGNTTMISYMDDYKSPNSLMRDAEDFY
jgi:hypothetical protein